jgi:hypothetical protein
MYKFLKRSSQYILAIFLLGYAVIYFSIAARPGKMLGNATEYELWRYKKELINTRYDHTINLMIGDSRIMTGLNPVLIGHNFINLSLSGTTAFEGYSTLKRILAHNKIDTLVIGYGIFHYLESDVLDKWTLLYQFPTVSEIDYLKNVERKYNITLDNQQPNYALYLNRKATYFHVPTAFRQTFIENLKQNDYKAFIIARMRQDIGFSNVSTADSASGTNTEVELARKEKQFRPNPVVLSYLDSIYNISVGNRTKMVLIIPPINATSYRALSSTRFWSQYLNFLEQLRLKYPKMLIDNKNPYLPNTYFADNNHLNHRGYIFFSNYLKDSVIEKGPHLIP